MTQAWETAAPVRAAEAAADLVAEAAVAEGRAEEEVGPPVLPVVGMVASVALVPV